MPPRSKPSDTEALVEFDEHASRSAQSVYEDLAMDADRERDLDHWHEVYQTVYALDEDDFEGASS